MSKLITIDDINEKARKIALDIDRASRPGGVPIYGVPRGGIAAAFAIASQGSNIVVVGTPEEAAIIVDDLIDSGRTKAYYQKMYPQKPFFALFDKPEEWLTFPWEISGEDTSADDIPTRLLQYVGEEPERGGLQETPKRFLKAWKHFTSGYGKDPAAVMKVFEDGAEKYDEMVLVKSIPVYSQCEHHLVPFFGVAHIAYIPNGKIVGLSKLSRVVDVFARRLQVQERLTSQIADSLEANLKPLGVAVVIECRHLCMESRGISQQGQVTTTSAMRGVFRDDDSSSRAEFMGLINKS